MSNEAPDLADRRATYAREIAARFGCQSAAVVAAFATVPREAFLGPPPWFVSGGAGTRWTEETDPAAVYQDRLIALDRVWGINNGQPSLHAISIEALALRPSDHVLHIGAGTGYYTAILAECAGTVDAFEIDPDLAAAAARNLRPWKNVTVHAETGTGRPLPPADAIYVNAGASFPDPAWLDALRDGGRLLFPLTDGGGFGAMLLAVRHETGFAARFMGNVSFIACAGARDPAIDARLTEAFARETQDRVRSLTRAPPPSDAIWFAGGGWYLSTQAVAPNPLASDHLASGALE